MRKTSCIKWSWWRKYTQLDGFLYPMTNGRELSHWKCSHGTFGWSVSTLSDWMMGHLFIFLAFLEIIMMHHLIVRSLGILVGWMIPILIGVGHGTKTYLFAATSL